MYESRFSNWCYWQNRKSLRGLESPGVYVLAYYKQNMTGKPFRWSKRIIYIGMTNAIAGLWGRLKQFDNTINGKRGHGGADRVRYKYQNYDSLANHLFVAIVSFPCDVTSNQPVDLKIMGKVAQFEYLCFSQFSGKFGCLPEFNDKKRSPKYSKTCIK